MNEQKSSLQSHVMSNTLIQNVPGMLCRFRNDLDWTMVYMSEGCLELTGYLPQELIGNRTTSYGKITFEGDNKNIWEIIQQALEIKNSYQIEYRILTKSGQMKWVWEQGTGLYDTAGNLEAIEAFMTDITSRKKTEENLNSTIKQLNERNFELDNFTYRISHDLRAPLLTIYGLTNLMRSPKIEFDVIDFCDKIDLTVKKLEIFTKELLDYSRTRGYSEEIARIDFDRLITDSLRESGYPDYESYVKVNIVNTSSSAFASEPFRLRIILSNLFCNAIKYRDTQKETPSISIYIRNTDTYFEMEVTDNGIGIEYDYQKEIFKMFYRASEKSDGSGLGLYIVKMNIESLSGRIECYSKPGIGTTFRIILPMVHEIR
jgi:PAS domain S-box-containing protein